MKLRTWAFWAVLSTFLLMLIGAWVVKTGAGLSCPDWPKCNGEFLPPFPSPQDSAGNDQYTQAQILSEWTHRLAAAVTGVLNVGLIVAAFRRYRDQGDLMTLSVGSGGLLFAQILMGAATVKLLNAPWTVVVHQGLAVSYFGVLVAIWVLAWRRESETFEAASGAARGEGASRGEASSRLRVLGDYITLVKPRVLMLLLIAAVTSMLIAAGPTVTPWMIMATVLGGAMASGGASAFNQWYEADRDRMMTRTALRPVAAGRIPPHHVLAFSLSLLVGSFMVLSVFVNLLAAFLALGGGLFYIAVYTIWLKPSSVNNTVVGGVAGAMPVLVGWAAATGQVTLPALVLGFILFLWQPPHFWAFALLHKEDYARAGIPMLPVVRGDDVTRQQIFLYAVALLVASTSLWVFGVLSPWYLLVSMVLGALFVYLALQLLLEPADHQAQRLFRYSILYLGLLFVFMAVDTVWILPNTI